MAADQTKKGLSKVVKVTVVKPRKPRSIAPGNKDKLTGNGRKKPADKIDGDGFTDLERRFVELYTISWHLSAAVRNAGYQVKNAASYGQELLERPHIKAYVDKHRKKFRDDTQNIRDRLTAALIETAFYDASEYLEQTPEKDKKGKLTGRSVPTLKEGAVVEAGRLIKKFKVGKDMKVELELDSREHARDMLAKHIDYFNLDNKSKATPGAVVYLPDNGRGDVINSNADEDEE